MLIRSTWTFTVESPTTLPRTYALALSQHLHQLLGIELGQEQIPATTFSGLLGDVQVRQDFITLLPNQPYQLALCGLQKEASAAIAILTLPDEISLLGAVFHVQHAEQKFVSYEDLYHEQIACDPVPARRFKLRFLTPTAFSQNRTYLPLPLPTLMFRSWLERWNRFSPVYLGGNDLIDYLGEAVVITRHRIQTQSIQVVQARITGFTGEVVLHVLSRADPLLANVANLLIHYAEFSGTGIKSRLGMGNTVISVIDSKL